MRDSYLFTSESVSEGHPDKVADQISDSIVDLFLSIDDEARIACETLCTTQLVVLAGEIRGRGIYEDGEWAPGIPERIEAAVRQTVKDIGYEQAGFHWDRFESGFFSVPPSPLGTRRRSQPSRCQSPRIHRWRRLTSAL